MWNLIQNLLKINLQTTFEFNTPPHSVKKVLKNE
jgi:hypothetical protein